LDSKVKKFISYTYLFSWNFWLFLSIAANQFDVQYGESLYLFLFILGGLGPFYVAFIIYNPKNELRKYKRLKRKVLKWKVNIRWYFWVFTIPFLLFLLPWVISTFYFKNNLPLFTNNINNIFYLLLINIVLGGLEEVGWRGVLLAELFKKYNKITATVTTSLVWTFWHFPLWFIAYSPQKDVDFLFFLILGLGFSFQFTIFYLKTKSIFLCILMHSIFNTYLAVISFPTTRNYLYAGIILLFSFIIFIIIYPKELSWAKN